MVYFLLLHLNREVDESGQSSHGKLVALVVQ